MLPEVSLALSKWKLVGASVLAIGAFLADVAAEPKTLEDYSLKGLLLVAVVYLVRQGAKDREEHRADAIAREEKLHATIEANNTALKELKTATEVQIGYFEKVGQKIIDGAVDRKP